MRTSKHNKHFIIGNEHWNAQLRIDSDDSEIDVVRINGCLYQKSKPRDIWEAVKMFLLLDNPNELYRVDYDYKNRIVSYSYVNQYEEGEDMREVIS